MGWCPNTNTLLTKRRLITLPSDEKIQSDEKRKSDMNHIKMGWGNKYRNVFFIPSLLFFILTTFFALITPGYFEFFLFFLKETLLREILITIILAVFLTALHWRDLNRIKEGNLRSTKWDIVGWIIIASLFLHGFLTVTGKALPFDFILNGVMGSLLICFFIMYPMILYWEWKNRMTIYLVEEKSPKWRPVAFPCQR